MSGLARTKISNGVRSLTARKLCVNLVFAETEHFVNVAKLRASNVGRSGTKASVIKMLTNHGQPLEMLANVQGVKLPQTRIQDAIT